MDQPGRTLLRVADDAADERAQPGAGYHAYDDLLCAGVSRARNTATGTRHPAIAANTGANGHIVVSHIDHHVARLEANLRSRRSSLHTKTAERGRCLAARRTANSPVYERPNRPLQQ